MSEKNEYDKKLDNILSNIKKSEAVVKDPASLTEDIMSALKSSDVEPDNIQSGSRISIFRHVMFRRMISAAAIILFSVFAFEQIIILDKLNRLEESRHHSPINEGWEMQTVLKYREVKEDHKTFFDIVESFSKDNGSKPGILKKYFQHKSRINISKQNNMGIH